jgi:hypothetical protein
LAPAEYFPVGGAGLVARTVGPAEYALGAGAVGRCEKVAVGLEAEVLPAE